MPIFATAEDTNEGPTNAPGRVSTQEGDGSSEMAMDNDSIGIAKTIHNILVIGTDVDDNERETGRSDVMMLLSYNPNTNKACLTSFMRDIWIDIPNHGYNRLNAAHAIGGPEMLIDTLNENFSLDIESYVLIDFFGLISIVDSIGGIEIHITREEAVYINRHARIEEDRLPEEDGVYVLVGTQALTHCRNRSVGNADFERTRRQRDVIVGLYSSIRNNSNPKELWKLLLSTLKYAGTNMKLKEIINLSTAVLFDDKLEIEQIQVPLDDTWRYASKSGRSVLEIDLNANREELLNRFSQAETFSQNETYEEAS
jgi:LCP family protein required for cell wall assembly